MGASNRRSQNIHDNSRFFEFEGIQEWLHLADAAALGCCIVVVLLSQMDVWVIEFQQVFGVAVLFEVCHIVDHASGLQNALSNIFDEDPTIISDFDECLKCIAMIVPETEPGQE
ncbi:hypothetical protein Tco_1034783 [Tanacetum coccineum]